MTRKIPPVHTQVDEIPADATHHHLSSSRPLTCIRRRPTLTGLRCPIYSGENATATEARYMNLEDLSGGRVGERNNSRRLQTNQAGPAPEPSRAGECHLVGFNKCKCTRYGNRFTALFQIIVCTGTFVLSRVYNGLTSCVWRF